MEYEEPSKLDTCFLLVFQQTNSTFFHILPVQMTSFLQTRLQDHSTIQQSKHGCSLSAFPSAISICVGFFFGFCSPSSFQSPQYLGHLLLILLHSLSQAGRCDQKHIHSSCVINSYIFTEVIQKNALQKHNTLGIDRQLSSHIFIQTVPLPFSDFIFNLRAFFFPKIKIKKNCLFRESERRMKLKKLFFLLLS